MSLCFLGVLGDNHAHKVPKSYKEGMLKFILSGTYHNHNHVKKFKPLTELLIESSWKT